MRTRKSSKILAVLLSALLCMNLMPVAALGVDTAEDNSAVAGSAQPEAAVEWESVEEAEAEKTDVLEAQELEEQAVQAELEMLPSTAEFDAGQNGLVTTREAAAQATGFASGQGTQDDPYIITDASQLAYLSTYTNDGSDCSGLYFALGADISLEGITWTPIGSSTSTMFKGNFDGRGYTVSGLSITGNDYLGLFGRVHTASIANINVEGAISAGGNVVGGLAAYVYNSTISNAHTNVTITGSFYTAGGIMGTVGQGCTISKCSSCGDISSTHAGVTVMYGIAGIAGYGSSASGTVFDQCFSSSNITSSDPTIGGLLGYMQDTITVTNCYATGSVTSNYTGSNEPGIGGLIGRTTTSKVAISNCYATGEITVAASNTRYVGALLGHPISTVSSSNSYISNNYAASGTYLALGASSSGASYDVSGKAETIDYSSMLDGSFAAQMGASFVASDGRTPQLAWEDATAQHVVGFAIGLSTDENESSEAAQIVVTDMAGNVQAANGDGTYSLANGTYLYTVNKKGYESISSSFTVCGEDMTVSETLQVLTYALTLEVSPYDATVNVTKGETSYAYASYEPGDASTPSRYTYLLVNGEYDVTVERFGYDAQTVTQAISFEGAAQSISLVAQSTFALNVDVALPDGVEANSIDPQIDIYLYDALAETAGEKVATLSGQLNAEFSLPAGTYLVSARAAGCERATGVVELAQGETCTFELMLAGAWDGSTADTSFYEEDASVLYIRNAADLAGFSQLVNAGNSMQGKSVYLLADIDLAENSFAKIGTYTSSSRVAFSGAFEGQGHSIAGLYISVTSAYTGLFGYLENASVKNFSLAGLVTSTATNTGALAGRAESSVIEGVTSSVVVSGSSSTGGIVGYANTGTQVIGCVNSGTVTASGQYVGGIVGNLQDASSITGSTNSASVSSTGTSGYPCGGIVGYMTGGSQVVQCANTGNVTGNKGVASSTGVGGIAGSASNSSSSGQATAISECYNTGTIGGAIGCAGGIVGGAGSATTTPTGSILITNCYNVGTICTTDTGSTGSNNAGGIAGVIGSTTSIVNCYNAGAIDAEWLDGGYKAGIVGYIRTISEERIVNNYCVGDSEFALGQSDGIPIDYEGAAQTVSDAEMKTAAMARQLGGAYGITQDAQQPYYNEGYPYLLWQNPYALYDVTFAITLDTDANDDGAAASVQVFDESGAAVDPDSDDGLSYSVARGTYTYTVSKLGYVTQASSFTVTGSAVDLALELAAISYQVTLSIDPVNADAQLKCGDEVIEAQSVDTETGMVVFKVYNGDYNLTLRKFGYETYSAPISVRYGDVSESYAMTRKATYDVTFSVEAQKGSSLNEFGAVVRVIDEQTGDEVYCSREGTQSVASPDAPITTVLPEGSYSYLVQAGGFVTQQGTFSVEGNATDVQVALQPAEAWGGADDTDERFYSEQRETVYVANASELASVAALVNGGTTDFAGQSVVLMEDIDLAYQQWISIGYYGSGGKVFSGTFDGNGYAVNNFSMQVGQSEGVGLIGYASDATIQNVVVRGNISGSATNQQVMYAASIVAYAGNSKIVNCGSEAYLDITNAYTSSNILDIGGVVGWAVDTDITGCYASGRIYGSATSMVYAGGIVGFLNYSSATGNFSDNYNLASVCATGQSSATYVYAGGLTGVQGGTCNMANCYNAGQVEASGATTSAAGSLVGSMSDSSRNVVTNAYWLENTAASAFGSADVAGRIDAQMQTDAAMADPVFAETLGDAYVPNNNAGGYPLLAWQDAVASITVSQLPDKTAYNDRENFDDAGMVLSITYASGVVKEIESGWVVRSGYCLTPTQEYVTIDYHGATCQVAIDVTQIEHEIEDAIAFSIAAPQVGAQPQTEVELGTALFTASITWTQAGQPFEGAFEEATYYRAHVTLTSYYVDDDAWWVFADEVEPEVSGAYEILYTTVSDDGQTVTFDLGFAPTTSASADMEPNASHLYYEGDAKAPLYSDALAGSVAVDIEGAHVEKSVSDIEQLVLDENVGVQTDYSYIDENGELVDATLSGVGLYDFIRSCGLPADASDDTVIVFGSNSGEELQTTLGAVRAGGLLFQDGSDTTSSVRSIIAYAYDLSPMRASSVLLTSAEGPLMLALGMQSDQDDESHLFGVNSVSIASVVHATQSTLAFNVSDGEAPLQGCTVTVADSYGNSVAGTGYEFQVNDGDIYTYTVTKQGHTAFSGTVEVDGEDVTVDVVLGLAWDGETLVEPQTDDEGYYLIGTAEELMWWNANGQRTDNVKLTADIAIGDTLNYNDDTPKWENRFGEKEEDAYTGTFDGQGHTISGLYIERENTIDLWTYYDGSVGMLADRQCAVGLFGYTSGATIKDLGVVGKIHVIDRPDSLYADYLHVGGIVGFSLTGTTISGCYANVSILAETASGGGTLGGYPIDGWPDVSDTYIGGIAGSLGSNSSISNCYSTGTLIGAGTRSEVIGGVVGGLRLISSYSGVTVENSYSTANIYAYPMVLTSSFRSYLGSVVGNVNVFGGSASLDAEESTIALSTLEEQVEPAADDGIIETGYVIVRNCFGLSQTISATNDAKSWTYAGRVAGSSWGELSDNYGLGSMSLENVTVSDSVSYDGSEISAAAARFESTYKTAGWSSEIWQLDREVFPVFAWQDPDTMIASMDGSYVYTDSDPGESDGTFGSGAPPTTFTLNVQVAGHTSITHKTYTSTQMRRLAAQDSTETLRYSSYSYGGAAGRVATEYIYLDTLLEDADLDFESGDVLLMGGTYSYDTYFAEDRYYFPNWNSGSSAGAQVVEPAIVLKSYGTSSGASDAWFDVYASMADYLWAYVLNYGQTNPYDMTYSYFIYQQTGATLRYDAGDPAENVFIEMLDELVMQANADRDATTVAEDAAKVAEGEEFVSNETYQEFYAQIMQAAAVLNDSNATNDEVMDAIELLQSRISAFDNAKQTGTKGIDLAPLAGTIAVGEVDLAETYASTSAAVATGDEHAVSAEIYVELLDALELAQRYIDDAYASQEMFGEMSENLLAIIDKLETSWQQGSTSADESWMQLAGDDRYLTSANILGYGTEDRTIDNVVIASGADFPDATAASALAGQLDAPIVISSPDGLDDETLAQIARMGASNAVIVGGEAALSSTVEEQLEQAGLSVSRVWGATRVETAMAVSDEVMKTSSSSTAIVAASSSFADALSISPYAYTTGSPIYLTATDGTLDASTLEAIQTNDTITDVVIVGGTSAVAASVQDALVSAGYDVERLGGADRYATSKLIAEWSVDRGACSAEIIGIATGKNFPDALTGSAFLGARGGVLLLADEDNMQDATSFISQSLEEFAQGYFFGGDASVTPVVQQVCREAGGE